MKLDWKTCFKVGVSLFVLFLCITYWPTVGGFISRLIGAASPLFIGFGIAYVLNILLTSYERLYFPKATKKAVLVTRRPVCITLSIVTLLAIIGLVVGLVVPQLISAVQLIISLLPGAVQTIIDAISGIEWISDEFISTLSSLDWKGGISQIMNVLTSGLGGVVDVVITTVTSVFSGIITAFISIIFSVYLLSSKDKLLSQANRLSARYMKKTWCDKARYVLSVMNQSFRRYIVGQCTEALILGVLCFGGMLLFRLPYAPMISALVAFTALIPVAGAYIGAGVGALMILTVSPFKALIFLVFIIVLQQLEGNLIYPKVVGSSIGMPGIWVLAAVTLGGGIFGVLGMLLGVPLAATIYRILKNDVNKGEAEVTSQQ